jgi:hypothetical protein
VSAQSARSRWLNQKYALSCNKKCRDAKVSSLQLLFHFFAWARA